MLQCHHAAGNQRRHYEQSEPGRSSWLERHRAAEAGNGFAEEVAGHLRVEQEADKIDEGVRESDNHNSSSDVPDVLLSVLKRVGITAFGEELEG
jgi:hypothetical protein